MLGVSRNHAYQDHAPANGRELLEPQRLEWNLNDHRVAAAGDFCVGMPDRVKGVVRPPAFCKQSILLDAVRVGIKIEVVALVMKRIQPQAYVDVFADAF